MKGGSGFKVQGSGFAAGFSVSGFSVDGSGFALMRAGLGGPRVDDQLYMKQALALAERGRGSTSPNPMVGALVVDAEGIVVGRGFHRAAGEPHAEIHALREAGERTRGATLYCTLEPCSHTGRTGPCAPAVASAGIRRAVIAIGDPNPLVAGRGLSVLRERGVDVTVGTLADEAWRLNAAFFAVMRKRRPFVTLKVALSADGKVAARPGTRTRLTGAAADRFIQRERAEVDAVAVGSGTVLADDPLLTARGAFRKRPLTRVVFDRSIRMPSGARLLSTLDAGPIMVMTLPAADARAASRAEALETAGARVEVIDVAKPEGFLPAALERLGTLGVGSLIVEGGPSLHRALVAAGLVDRVQLFRTPAVLGEAGLSWLDGNDLPVDRLHDVRTTVLGPDTLVEGYVHRPD